MAEYIKKAYVEQCMNDSFRNGGIPAEARKKFQKWLDKAPAADVRPVVRGEWEYISFMTVKCSNCQEIFHELEGDNFCPNCGADMRERR